MSLGLESSERLHCGIAHFPGRILGQFGHGIGRGVVGDLSERTHGIEPDAEVLVPEHGKERFDRLGCAEHAEHTGCNAHGVVRERAVFIAQDGEQWLRPRRTESVQHFGHAALVHFAGQVESEDDLRDGARLAHRAERSGRSEAHGQHRILQRVEQRGQRDLLAEVAEPFGRLQAALPVTVPERFGLLLAQRQRCEKRLQRSACAGLEPVGNFHEQQQRLLRMLLQQVDDGGGFLAAREIRGDQRFRLAA